MSLFPKIARPCPYIDRLDTVIEADFCTMCKRQVHDLTDMDEAARRAFLAECGGSVCVRYTVWMKPAMAAAALAASAGGMSALGAGLGQPPRPPAAEGAIGAIPVVGEPVALAGEPMPIAGGIGPMPEPQSQRNPPPRVPRPPRLRPLEPLPEVMLQDIPVVTAGLPALPEVKPEPKPISAPEPPAS